MPTLNFDDANFLETVQNLAIAPWSRQLAEAVHKHPQSLKHGHLGQWQQALERLPNRASPCPFRISDGAVHIECSLAKDEQSRVRAALEELKPWRKGPYQFDTIFIDTEWRSDWKWDRLAASIQPLNGRAVLDVGCGNGYHLWRMHMAGAGCVLGIDPSLHYLMQFDAVQHFIREQSVQFLPLPMESLPPDMHAFDTVFSMGVLYHRRDPSIHLTQLRQALRERGELVLETLVIAGDEDDSLITTERYANMRNVYELPTVSRLERWLNNCGFSHTRLVSVARTSRKEQRSTPWMTSHSLAEALDADNPELTVEGYPRPLRAIVVAQPH